ncbi:MAG: hydroxymethylglutaryl-CoA synthase [Candidatus Hydrothermarchaeaceae archaeon]
MDVGIVGYGAYIPRYRITVEEIAKVWGSNAENIAKGLLISEKAVAGLDEDASTISVEAARNAVKMAGIDPKRLGAIYVGSESHPYTVKPTATIVAEAVEATPELTAADYEFACKAATAGIQTCTGLVSAGMVEFGMVIGADTAQGAPGDALEYTAASGGVAYIIGKEGLVARLEGTYSYTTDTPDFWRKEGQAYPRHGGRFTGTPAYFKHVYNASKGLMEQLDMAPDDFEYAVFHQPNGKFPRNVAKMLGFSNDQIKDGMLVDRIGNTYSGSSVLGLAKILDIAKPGARILMTSFGSGAGSDSFGITVEDGIVDKRKTVPSVEEFIKDKKYVDYSNYVKMRRKLKV